ncbi:MAG: hypothetical protein R2764_13475 [Bacteroidales bacterium]
MKNLLYIFFFLLIAANVIIRVNPWKEFLLSDSYTNCEFEYFNFGETITLSDHYEKFMITLPYSWAIQEACPIRFYGIIASTVLMKIVTLRNLFLITVTAIKQRIH